MESNRIRTNRPVGWGIAGGMTVPPGWRNKSWK